MRQAFEAVTSTYENVKKAVQEKWEGFKKKFEGTKTEMAQEVMKAESPDDMIALGKKMMESGEAMKREKEGIKQEESGEEEKHQTEKAEMIGTDHEEAFEINKAFDENKAAEEEANKRAEIAEQDRLLAEKEAAELAAVRAKISGESTKFGEQVVENAEDMPVKKVEAVAIENMDMKNGESSSVEDLAEKIGTPKNETFEKYGDGMRKAADELVLVVKEMRIKDGEMKSLGEEYAAAKGADAKSEVENRYNKIRDEKNALNDRRNELRDDTAWGSKILKDPGQKMGESFKGYQDKRFKSLNEYREAAMDDPYVVLRMIESGELGIDAGGNGLGEVSERLLGNPEFVGTVIKMVSKLKAGPFSGWFWKNVTGEARASKELFVEAVKLNHLNYNHGSNEWKSDSEVQKTALQSGLDPIYLYKG